MTCKKRRISLRTVSYGKEKGIFQHKDLKVNRCKTFNIVATSLRFCSKQRAYALLLDTKIQACSFNISAATHLRL